MNAITKTTSLAVLVALGLALAALEAAVSEAAEPAAPATTSRPMFVIPGK